jgi:hypothetical protein
MKLKKLVPIFAPAAAATLAGCDATTPSNTSTGPGASAPTATQTTTAPEHHTGFSYGVHVGPHYNMSTGKIDMLSIGPGIDF